MHKYYFLKFVVLSMFLWSGLLHAADIKLELFKKRGEKVIFLLGDENRITPPEDYSIYDQYNRKIGVLSVESFDRSGEKVYGHISFMKKPLKLKQKYVLKNESKRRDYNRAGALLELKKRFSHIFVYENTTKSYSHFQSLTTGVSGAGKVSMEDVAYGLGVEHLVSVMEDRFRLGGAFTYELSRKISFSQTSFSNGNSIGGSRNDEISHVWTLYGNFSIPIQRTFDLYLGFNYSELEIAGTNFDSFGYHAGIAAMRDHVRLGGIYRINVYEALISGGLEKYVANELLLTVGYVF